MTGRLLAVLSVSLLASCATVGERLNSINPLNFLGDRNEAPQTQQEDTAETFPDPQDGKTDIARVTRARLDYTPSGVIVRANGEAPSLGYHSTSLRPLNFGQPDGNGALWYEFRATPPAIPRQSGSEFARTLSVADFIPNSRLKNVQSVTITGAQNEVTIRLR